MEVSGHKDWDTGSRQYNILCQPCQSEDENIPATSFCETCNIFICASCFRSHRKLPLTKNHVIKSKDEMPRTPTQTDPCSELCATHKTEIVKFYCLSHDEVGCGDCMVVHHKACKVDLVPNVSGNYRNSEELQNVKCLLDKVVQQITSHKEDIKSNLKAAAEIYMEVVEEIKTFREDINIYLDNAEAELLKDVKRLRDTDESLQNKLLEECEAMHKELEKMQRALESNMNRTNHLFVSAKFAKRKLKMCQESADIIEPKCQIHVYRFEPDKDLMTPKLSKSALGSVTLQSKKNTGPGKGMNTRSRARMPPPPPRFSVKKAQN